ncbi:hypothetical protein MKZ19_19285 [Shouchella clausii]|uniref:hypothetical protein n=1 Tax=Shouchella clausii TaxID=79880 RepID=UPI001B1C8A4E|nr:hypothetical protein [Shouchella clausii]GIN05898.1 hypothetical protein J1TS1_00430 [Shouchella clausii]
MIETVTYKVEMSLTGRLTQLPDSQKIFGALIYMYAEQYSSERATLLVSKIREGEIYFSLSNMLPRDYFPTPQTYLLDPSSGQPSDRSDSKKDKKTYKAIKHRSFMKLAEIYKAMDNPNHADNLYPFACIESSQQIHAAIDSLRYDIPGLDPNVYSVPEVNVVEVLKEGKKEIVTKFSFYLCADKCDESAELLDALQHAKESKRRFFLGARASQGFNTFVVESIQAHEFGDSGGRTNTYLNLGMLLPQAIDFEESSLKLFTSERRPYHSAGGWDKELSGQFISFIEAGSIILVTEGRKKAGGSILSPFNNKDKPRDIVFGNAFLLPIQLDRRKQYDAPVTS